MSLQGHALQQKRENVLYRLCWQRVSRSLLGQHRVTMTYNPMECNCPVNQLKPLLNLTASTAKSVKYR